MRGTCSILVKLDGPSLTRAMKLPLDETVTEANFREVFEAIVEGLVATGNMASDESAACITFPTGTTQIEVPRGRATSIFLRPWRRKEEQLSEVETGLVLGRAVRRHLKRPSTAG